MTAKPICSVRVWEQIFVRPTDVTGLSVCACNMFLNCPHDTGQIQGCNKVFKMKNGLHDVATVAIPIHF